MKQVGKNLEAPPSVQRLVRILWLDCFVCSCQVYRVQCKPPHLCQPARDRDWRSAQGLRFANHITLFFVMFSFILFTFTRQRNQIKHHKASFKVPKHTQSTSLGFPNSSPFVISFISCQVFRFSPPRSFALVHVYNI